MCSIHCPKIILSYPTDIFFASYRFSHPTNFSHFFLPHQPPHTTQFTAQNLLLLHWSEFLHAARCVSHDYQGWGESETPVKFPKCFDDGLRLEAGWWWAKWDRDKSSLQLWHAYCSCIFVSVCLIFKFPPKWAVKQKLKLQSIIRAWHCFALRFAFAWI